MTCFSRRSTTCCRTPSNSRDPPPRSKLNAYAEGKRILIVEDRCGGLPPGDAERMFLPFTQYSSDKSGAGLGRRCVAAALRQTMEP